MSESTLPFTQETNFADWKPRQPEGNPHSLEFLRSALKLPNGLRLEARAPEGKGIGASYALVTEKKWSSNGNFRFRPYVSSSICSAPTKRNINCFEKSN